MTTELQDALSDGETLAVTQIQGALQYLAQAQRLPSDQIRALLDQLLDQLSADDSLPVLVSQATANGWVN